MNRTVLAVFLFGLPIAASATAIIANCNGVVAVPVDNSASCGANVEFGDPQFPQTAMVQAQASISFASSLSVFVDALESPGGNNNTGGAIFAESEVSGFVNVLVTGATGTGFIEACSSGNSDAGALAVVSFGGVSVLWDLESQVGPGPCFGPFSASRQYATPIVFGVPQVEPFSVQASAELNGQGDAMLSGFELFDADGNPLSDVTLSITDATPEPSAFFLCLAGLCVFCGAARLLSGGKSAESV